MQSAAGDSPVSKPAVPPQAQAAVAAGSKEFDPLSSQQKSVEENKVMSSFGLSEGKKIVT